MSTDADFEGADLRHRLLSQDAQVRRVAVLEFADCGEEDLLPAVIALLREDPESALRAEAARALAGCNDVAAVEALVLALNDQAPVRAAAASSLAELKDAHAGAVLLRHACHDDPFVRASVLRTLKELRIPAAAEPAMLALEHADASVRREAVGVLGWLKCLAAIPRIAGLAVADTVPVNRHDTDAGVRNRVAAVIGGYRFSGPLHPAHQVRLRNLQVARIDNHIDSRGAHEKCRSHIARPGRETSQQQHNRAQFWKVSREQRKSVASHGTP